ncbi:MAG TPA: hypothetical protein VGN72_01520 [Tepidisphaeraceae bacterium]|jgi:hypothetical protein|nr:hypothetical protein [Tepidisphaeraceae bacterium]
MRKLQVRLAALVGLLPLAGMIGGCDSATGQADADVAQLIAEAEKANQPGRIPALVKASQVDGASAAAKVNVHDLLGDEELAAARIASAEAGGNAATIAQLVADINRMNASVADAQRTLENLQKMEPVEPKQSIATKVQEMREGEDGVWVPPLRALTAVKSSATELQQKIGDAEGQISQLNEQRTAALTEAEQLQQQSTAATGREAVDLYKRASTKRKEAMDLVAQADVLSASLIPLRQDLAIAQAQEKLRAESVQHFEQQGSTIDQGWTEVQAAGTQLKDATQQIVSGDGTGAGSIEKTSSALATEVDEFEKNLRIANDHYDNAVNHYGLAAQNAQTVNSDLTSRITAAQDAPEVTALKAQQNTFTPAGFNLQKGIAQQELAILLSRQAQLATARATALTELAPVLTKGGYEVPAGARADGLADAAKAAVEKANTEFGSAVETLTTVSQAGGSTPGARSAKTAAGVSLMLTEYAWSQFAAAVGDTAAAQSHLAAARAARTEVTQEGSVALPALPPDLAIPTAAPAAPGAPGAPATPPATPPAS